MTKEELERIKAAYYSGLKVQIWFNGNWEDFDARDYSMYKDPFSENRQYRIVGSDYAEKAEKRIAELEHKLEQTEKELADYQFNYPTIKELEKENAELKEHIKADCIDCTDYYKNKRLEKENAELSMKRKAERKIFQGIVEKKTDQLTKAKEIIKKLINACCSYGATGRATAEAEQFLQETDIDNAIQKANEGLNLDKIAEEIEQDIKEQNNS